jgi:hypothetical protein
MPERTTRTETGERELQTQFMAHSEATLLFYGLSLSAEGKEALLYLFGLGATVMVSSQRLKAEDIGIAHASVSLYTHGIVLRARASRVEQIHPDIITRVRDFFCPGMWPFC